MRANYEMIIFDWDGTLMDSIHRIVTVFDHTFTQLGMPVAPAADVKTKIGLPLLTAFHQLVPHADQAAYDAMMATYRDIWLGETVPLSPPVAGVPELLDQLRTNGVRMAVATGKSRAGLERESKHWGFDVYFESSRCADEHAAKPAPDMLHAILEETGLTPGDALMIGDSSLDVGMAANAGIDAVGVLTGVADEPTLAAHSPIAVLPDVTQLRHLLGL